MVTIGVPAEGSDEPRVALTPETAKKLAGLGAEVRIEANAGARSHFTDAAFEEAGAKVVGSAEDAVRDGDIVLTVRRPSVDLVSKMKQGAALVAMLEPYGDAEGLQPLAATGVSLFSMEFMPRITRAQSMDVLSSQSNLAGYKAVLDAAAMFERALPMMMTAAGTVPAAKVFVMGAGVAGLQAIATARRLGAIVTATDVRPAAKEQVASLGAKFVAVEDEEFKQAETKAGYAKEMSAQYKKKQAELVAEHVKSQDMVVTTALIPGRPAPQLISTAMVESMRPGSIVVDLASERGGNCELTKPGEIVEHNGVRIVGTINVSSRLPVNASSLYARNLYSFVELMIDKEKKEFRINWDDEVMQGTLIARDGKIVHPSLTGEGAETKAEPALAQAKPDKPAPSADPQEGESSEKQSKPDDTEKRPEGETS